MLLAAVKALLLLNEKAGSFTCKALFIKKHSEELCGPLISSEFKT